MFLARSDFYLFLLLSDFYPTSMLSFDYLLNSSESFWESDGLISLLYSRDDFFLGLSLALFLLRSEGLTRRSTELFWGFESGLIPSFWLAAALCLSL